MPDFDWTLLGKINGWQTVATIAVIIIALFIIARFLMKFWPWLKKVIALGDALAQLPHFIERTDKSIEVLRHQVENDHKTNLRDEVTEVLETTGRMSKQIDKLILSDTAQWKQIDQTKPPARKRATPKKENP